ncbi:unnamed protein product [Thlaspi arvense]|uniref:Uncharacterized protein n=1 Tax=Thlaspi arvense TaxID=13288 RepID=A0AAU9T4N7_THLAR|nr:unnamed protein product [Thlaspi arvense]
MTTASSTVFQDVFTTNTEPEPPQRNRKAEITAAPEPDKGSLGSAAECSAAVNNGRDSDSSDEDEVDPILKKEFYRQLHESNGFDVDRVIPNNSLSMTICDNKPGLYHDMIVVYARVGLHWYNFHKIQKYKISYGLGSNLQLSRVDKFISIMCGIFEYSITLEAKDPANSSCLTFQTRVLRAGCINGEHLRIQTVGCRIKPQTQGTGDKIHRWEYNDGIGEVYKDNLPKWISDDALVPSSDQHHQFYQKIDYDDRIIHRVPDKGSLASAAECSAAVNNGRDSDSSDEDEVDPVLKKELYRKFHESDGFDVDITIPNTKISVTKCDNNKPGHYPEMIDIYARVGLHWYNFHKGSNFHLSRVDKYVEAMWGIFENEYYITLEAIDPANNSCFTFQASVTRTLYCINGEPLRIQTVGCRIKPQTQGTGDQIHRWEYHDGIDEFYKGNLPKWLSDDALVPSSDQHHQFYQVQDSDIRENDWLYMYAEFAMYSQREGDMTLLVLAASGDQEGRCTDL